MKSILYFESDRDTADAVKTILENNNYRVDIVETEQEAMLKIQHQEFDMVFLDLLTPEMYGFDIYDRLKKIVRSSFAFHSPVPLSPGIIRLFQKVGIGGYIKKPFNKTELINMIDSILGSQDTPAQTF